MAQPYIPRDLPIPNFDWPRFVHLIGKANAGAARFDAMVQTLHNPILLLRAMTAQEAVLPSKIEGMQATLDELGYARAGLKKYQGTEVEDDATVCSAKKEHSKDQLFLKRNAK